MIVDAVLFALVLAATVADLWKRKIYNWLTYPGILAALAINSAGSLWEMQSEGAAVWKQWIGWVGLVDSMGGLLACGGCMLLCYGLFPGIGGGDVKLTALLGAFLGVERGVECLLWTIVLGAALSMIVLVWKVGAIRLLMRAGRQLVWSLRIGGWSPLTPEERSELQVPLHLAPCALAALVVVLSSR